MGTAKCNDDRDDSLRIKILIQGLKLEISTSKDVDKVD